MSNEIATLDLSNLLPADVLSQIVDAQEALEGSFSSGAAYLGFKRHKFSINQGGTVTVLDEGNLDIIIVHARPTDHRIYYEGEYVEGADTPPTCWSSDNVTPDDNVPASARQSDKCADCPMNMKGSGGSGKSKACATKRRAIILRANDETYTPIIADLGAMSIYQTAEPRLGLFNFNEVVRQLGAFRKKNANLASFCFLLQMSFTDASVPVVQFSFVDQKAPHNNQPRIAPKHLIEKAIGLWKDGEVQRLADMEIARPPEDTDTTPAPKTKSRPAQTMAQQAKAQPEVAPASKPEPEPEPAEEPALMDLSLDAL